MKIASDICTWLSSLSSSDIATILIAIFTGLLVFVAWQQNQMSRSLNRAYVFMPDFEYRWHRDTDRPGKFWWQFRPIWQNFGNTQAKNMSTNVVFCMVDKPLPEDFGFPPAQASFPAFLTAHGTILGAMGTLTDDELASVQSGEKFFYMYGTATYRDVFRFSPVRTATFCRQITDVYGDVTRPDKTGNVVTMFFAMVFPDRNTTT